MDINQNSELKFLVKGMANLVSRNVKQRLGLFMAVPLVVVALLAGTFYYQYEHLKSNPQEAAARENEELISTVSRLMILPEGEQPTVATVSDPDALKDQPFFARAKKGDKVLIYTANKKAILYDPDQGKIVEVAPLNVGAPQSSPEPGLSR